MAEHCPFGQRCGAAGVKEELVLFDFCTQWGTQLLPVRKQLVQGTGFKYRTGQDMGADLGAFLQHHHLQRLLVLIGLGTLWLWLVPQPEVRFFAQTVATSALVLALVLATLPASATPQEPQKHPVAVGTGGAVATGCGAAHVVQLEIDVLVIGIGIGEHQVDDAVGAVVNQLAESGVADRTVVVFATVMTHVQPELDRIASTTESVDPES